MLNLEGIQTLFKKLEFNEMIEMFFGLKITNQIYIKFLLTISNKFKFYEKN